MKLYFSIIFLFFYSLVYTQQEFGLEVTKELCSEKYEGRGYVNDGHKKAADYIAGRFDEFQLKKFEDSYFQYFNIVVNTFPDSVSCYLDNKKLLPGEDYILEPSSGSAKGLYSPFIIDRNSIVTFIGNLQVVLF